MYDNIDTTYAIVHLFHCLLFMLICVHYCIDVVAVVVVEIHSIQFNSLFVLSRAGTNSDITVVR